MSDHAGMIGRQIDVFVKHARECINEDTPFDVWDDWNMAHTSQLATLLVDLGFAKGEYVEVMGEPFLNKIGTIQAFLDAFDHEPVEVGIISDTGWTYESLAQ
jgi:hypothetical protein